MRHSKTDTYTILSDRLDQIRVYHEEFDGNQHMITIVCYGEAWSQYWSAIGDLNIWEFFCGADEDYLATKFLSGNTTETDWEKVGRMTGIGSDLDKDSYIWYINDLEKILGPDWYYDMPTKDTSECEYLKRIIQAIKTAMEGFE